MAMRIARFKEEAEVRQTVKGMGSNLKWLRTYIHFGAIVDNLNFKDHATI